MKDMRTVSASQMAVLFFAFMTGSSIIYVPSVVIEFAHHGAWMSLAAMFPVGCFLLACILYMNRKYPGLSLIGYSRQTLGSVLTVLFAVFFTIYLLLMVSWITLGIGGFMTTSMMKGTPIYAFNSLIIASSAMTVRAGFEVMARLFVLYSGILVLFVFSILLLSLSYFHPEFILPIAPDGFKPVWHGSYFAFGFPYAEVIVFAMLLPFANRNRQVPSRLTKFMFISLTLNGVLLTTITISTIMVYGPLAPEIKYSLFSISRFINIADFFQRIESVIGISLIAGSYMKATIALFALNLAAAKIFKLKDDRILIFPISIVCFLLSITMFDNEVEFYEKFTQVWPLVNLACSVLPFLFIVLIACFKKGGNGLRE